MGRAMPHGRNYQCNPFSDYQTARDEWIALAQGVEAVRKTAQETMEDLLRQCDGMPGGRFAVAVDVLKVEG